MNEKSFSLDALLEHEESLRALANGILRDDHAAEDIVQEAFAVALQRVGKGVDSPVRWLSKVTRNLALNSKRSRRHRRQREEDALGSSHEPDSSEEVGAWIRAAVRELNEPYQTAVALRYFEGLAPTDIAQRLGLSVNTVKTQLRRGLEQLRSSLDARTDGDRRQWAIALAFFVQRGQVATLSSWAAWSLLALVVIPIAALWLLNRDLGDEAVPAQLAEDVESAVADVPEVPEEAGPIVEERVAVEANSEAELEEFGSLRLRLFYADDVPAPNVLMVFCPLSTWPVSFIEVVTNELGEVTVDLPSGKFEMFTDRGGLWGASIRAGETLKKSMRLRPGVRVEGLVSNSWGEPVNGAEIWLTTSRTDRFAGRVVTKTASDGRFTLLGVDPTQSIGAFHTEFAPPEIVDLDQVDCSQGKAEVNLRFDRLGGIVTGVVRDPTGEPVAGAQVAVGLYHYSTSSRVDGSFKESLQPRIVETSVRGEFRVSGVDTVDMLVFVRADGFPTAEARISVSAGLTTRADFQLEEPAMLSGIVRGKDGQPCEGVTVALMARDLNQLYDDPAWALQNSSFPMVMTKSAEDGSFVLQSVPSGERQFTAWNEAEHGLDRKSLVVEGGGTVKWDPIVDSGLALRGRVFDRAGKPLMTMLRVRALVGDDQERAVIPDSEGRFVIPRCRAVEHGISLAEGPDRTPRRAAPRWKAHPGEDEFVLQLSAPSGPLPARVRGAIADEHNRFDDPAAVDYRLTVEDGMSYLPGQSDGLAFEFENVPPGRYRVTAYAQEQLVHLSDWVEVAANQDVDLGVLNTRAGAGLVVTLNCEDGVSLDDVRSSLASDDLQAYVALTSQGMELVADNVQPGSHQLWVVAPGMAHVQRPLVLKPGETTRVAVDCVRGVDQRFLAECDDQAVWSGAITSLHDMKGRLLLEIENPFAGQLAYFDWMYRVPIGHYEMRVRTDTGLSASGTFEVKELDSERETIVLQLR